MSSTQAESRPASRPRVAALLVVHNGEEWLSSVLATIAAQRYRQLDLVVVDNASRDGSAELLARRIPADRLITLPRNVGFGRAVAAALQHRAVAGADLLLLLHDDLVLAPDAIGRLVRAMVTDPTLGIVGPKLREWSADYVLQEVGMTADRFGRAESQLEPGELDQGQHDRQRDVLYVSTAGMMLRRELLRGLGGFDARFPAFRDDLDLCWRAWLAGSRVEVVPDAVGYHIAASSRLPRPPLAHRAGEARYLAERHTTAALLKNYSGSRLAWVLPVVLLLAVAKVVGFLATRRFADAAAVVRAYAWNLGQLPRTLRRRRLVQRRRRVSDGELARLFAPGLPRLRSYADAMAGWLAGGDTRALIDDAELDALDPEVDPLADRAARRFLRDHPAACAGAVLGVLYVAGLVPLLGPGQIVGGEIGAWPETAREFLRRYASPWNGEPLGSGSFAPPAQALLGLASFAGLGSAWLAQRLLVLGMLPLAWMLALRAGRLVTSRRAPRALGATLYALSPVLLGALAQGRYGILVVGALLPGLVLVTFRAGDRRTAPGSAWRAAALLALGLAAGVAMAPALGVPLAGGWLVALAVTAVRPGEGHRQAALRLLVAGAGAAGILLPWLADVVRDGGLAAPVTGNAELPLWRAVAVVPDVLPGLSDLAGVLAAVASAAVVVVALLVGMRSRPGAVAGLVAVVAISGIAAWAAARATVDWVWPPGLLLPASLALAVLGVVAARWLVTSLRAYDFGGRQLATVIAAVVLGAGIVGSAARVATGPWTALAQAPELVPAFVRADAPTAGPYRVLLLAGDDGGVRWDVTGAEGPSMVDFGTLRSADLTRFFDEAVGLAAGGADPSAGARLGLANVRYVVLASASDELIEALAGQPALEPLPSSGGRVYRVRTWMPRAVVLAADRGDALLATGDPGVTEGIEERAFERVRPDVFRGPGAGPDPGVLVVSEASSPLWKAEVGGVPLERLDLPPVNAFRVPEGAAGRPEVRAGAGARHRLVVTGQVLLVLVILSLALRPPGFTRRKADRHAVRTLPSRLSDEEPGRPDQQPEGSAPAEVTP